MCDDVITGLTVNDTYIRTSSHRHAHITRITTKYSASNFASCEATADEGMY